MNKLIRIFTVRIPHHNSSLHKLSIRSNQLKVLIVVTGIFEPRYSDDISSNRIPGSIQWDRIPPGKI